MDALAAQDFTGEKTRRLPLDRSLLRLTLEETAVFRECTGIDNEDVLLDHIHGVAADAYAVRRETVQCVTVYMETQGTLMFYYNSSSRILASDGTYLQSAHDVMRTTRTILQHLP